MSGILSAYVGGSYTPPAKYYLTTFNLIAGDPNGVQGTLGYDATNNKVYVGQTGTGSSKYAFSRLSNDDFSVDYTYAPNAYTGLSVPYFLSPKQQPTTGNTLFVSYPQGSGLNLLASMTTGSTPSFNWVVKLEMSYGGYNNSNYYNYVPRSDGSIVVFGGLSGTMYVCCCAVTINTPAIAILSANGATWTNFANGTTGTYSNDGFFQGGAVAASGNIYAVGPRNGNIGNKNGGILMKYNSSGTLQWKKRFYNATTPTNFDMIGYAGNAVAIDSSENTYFAGYQSGANVTVKFNSSGAVVWARKFVASGGGMGGGAVKLDSAGNLYVYGGYSGYLYVLKYDSSGTLLYQRRWTTNATTYSTYLSANYYGLEIANDGSILYSGFGVSTGTYGLPVVMKVPADGSKTGTYSNASLNWTYSASSGTDSAYTWTVEDDPFIAMAANATPTRTALSNSGFLSFSVTQNKNTL